MGELSLDMKSARASHFMFPLGMYQMSYSESSTTHDTILPAKMGFFRTCWMRQLVFTRMVCPWKYGLSFLSSKTMAKNSFSIFWQRVLAPLNTLLMKYTCISALCASWTITECITRSMTERQRSKGESSFGRVRIEGSVRNSFTLVKSSSHSAIHLNFSFFLGATKKMKALSHTQERN